LEEVEMDELRTWVLGALIQMTISMVHEKRSHLAQMNAIGELCAQFARGALAVIRSLGADDAIHLVESYHRLHPAASGAAWHPDALARLDSPEWQQLYVNAEHDGQVGVISIGRESYNRDVDSELNRAIDWLLTERIDRVIVTGDFHLAGQMVGADTREFFAALDDGERGVEISRDWSTTARRLHRDFDTSVGLIVGKRCLGGMLELMMHCHYLVAVEDAAIGMPEVTLPVVPGMEGCHWPFRRTAVEHWPTLLGMLLEGRPARATDTIGWLVDFAGSFDDVLQIAWRVAGGGEHGIRRRAVVEDALDMTTVDVPYLTAIAGHEARRAILDTVRAACGATLAEALEVQARHSGGFMTSDSCRSGVVGTAARKTMAV
jgi:enoyl-CoA hydratase/carnithine racemase